RVSDVVGVGSATTQFMLDQLSTDYNSQHATASTKLYSWDAVPLGSLITSKSAPNCTNTTRPTGSSQGIGSSNPVPLSLEQNPPAPGGPGSGPAFARSPRPRVSPGSTPAPACASGGICFVALGGDAVPWADRSAAAGGTNAPATLTATQLK